MATRRISPLFILLAMTIPSVASAENWGAVDPNHRCTVDDALSQCVANNDTHAVYIDQSGFNSTLAGSITNAVNNDYDPIGDVVAYIVTNHAGADVYNYEWVGGPVATRAFGTCDAGSTFGGSGRNSWCKPVIVYYNNYYENSEWTSSNTAYRKWLTCHEIGHTLGLRHATPNNGHSAHWDDSCMRDGDVTGPPDPYSFDQRHLRDCYPLHTIGTDPQCIDW